MPSLKKKRDDVTLPTQSLHQSAFYVQRRRRSSFPQRFHVIRHKIGAFALHDGQNLPNDDGMKHHKVKKPVGKVGDRAVVRV